MRNETPTPKVMLTLRVPPTLFAKLTRKAKRLGITRTELILRALLREARKAA